MIATFHVQAVPPEIRTEAYCQPAGRVAGFQSAQSPQPHDGFVQLGEKPQFAAASSAHADSMDIVDSINTASRTARAGMERDIGAPSSTHHAW